MGFNMTKLRTDNIISPIEVYVRGVMPYQGFWSRVKRLFKPKVDSFHFKINIDDLGVGLLHMSQVNNVAVVNAMINLSPTQEDEDISWET
jgi:hypothetical protein